MKSSQVINLIRYAGYHDDYRTGLRLYVDNRVSYASFQRAFQEGCKARITGISCNCPSCARKGAQK